MYARLNYVGLKPELMTELKAFWRERVGAYKGLTKGHLLLDGDTGWSLSVVLFDSEASMEENTYSTLKGVAKDATRFRTSEPEVHMREVLAHLPGHAGKITYARVVDMEMKPKDVGEAASTWPALVGTGKSEAGFRHAYFCGDRKTGKIASVTFWDSKAAADSNESSGTFQKAIALHRALMTAPPKITHWDVVVVVGG
jgi:heme-degrading monooxygenase HmoA